MVTVKVGATHLLYEGETLENEKISYTVSKDGFYKFTGYWFWFLF